MNGPKWIALLVLQCGVVACGDFGDPSAVPEGVHPVDTPEGGRPPLVPEETPEGSAPTPDGAAAAPDSAEAPRVEAGELPPDGAPAAPDATAPTTGDGASPPPPADCRPVYATGPSRCTVTASHAECTHVDTTIGGRLVVHQAPMGTPPAGGFPAVVVYQGSLFGPTMTWSGDPSLPFGGFNQIKVQALLLDNGFIVIAPSADGVAWNTNFPGYEASPDSRFIPVLLDEIRKGTFGPVDMDRLYATGISSGGYMTSRMAVSYPGVFRALAIESGSYATCSNVLCSIPVPLPGDHPPTLFLHGRNDIAVPISTAQAYQTQLQAQGIETLMLVDPAVGHQWLPIAPEAIACWFMGH